MEFGEARPDLLAILGPQIVAFPFLLYLYTCVCVNMGVHTYTGIHVIECAFNQTMPFITSGFYFYE